MLSRRQFVGLVASSAFLDRRDLVGGRLGAAPRYDIIIKGGRVIDPSLRIDGVRDVAIVDGRIAAVEASLADDAAQTMAARGKLVVPGLLDIHTHAARVADGASLCLRDGVTGFIDAGSQGADRIGDVIAIATSAPQPCRVLINIGRAGVVAEGDTMDLARADVAAARPPWRAIATSSAA